MDKELVKQQLKTIEHCLDKIRSELNRKSDRGFSGNYSQFNNTDSNGNYDVNAWNERIREDR